MQDDTFRIGQYEYSVRGSTYYRWKIGKFVSGVKFEEKISKNTYLKSYRSYHHSMPTGYKTRTSFSLSSKWKEQLWSKSSWSKKPWNNSGRKIKDYLRPLTIDKERPYYGKVKYTANSRTGDKWGAVMKQGRGAENAFVLNGFKEWANHLRIARYQLSVQAEHFRIVVGQRALRIFQLSFEHHKFNNEDKPWKELAEYTREKRKWAGTWRGSQSSKLVEYGLLSGSLDYNDKLGNTSRISTLPVTVNRRYNKSWTKKKGGSKVNAGTSYSATFSYAAIHNEGVPKGRKPGAKIPQRQFMGWSSSSSMDKVDRFAYEVADRYLFDSVFMVKKR